MNLHVEEPIWLLLALLAIPMALIAWLSFGAMSPARRVASIIARLLLIALLAALLARASSMRTTSKLAVIAVVDTSGSVDRFYSIARGDRTPTSQVLRTYIQQAVGKLGPEDALGLVAFDGRAISVATPARTAAWERDLTFQRVEGTNIADALRMAAAMIPPDAAGRIVLLSDGNQTAGDALTAATEIASRMGRGRRGGLPIDVVPLSYKLDNEVVVESVDAPPAAAAQATINVRVVLWATAPSEGNLLLLREGSPLDLNGDAEGAGRRIALKPGRNVELIEVELGPGRVHRFEAVYEPDAIAAPTPTNPDAAILAGDTVIENNAAQAFTITPGRGSVLLVDGVSGGSPGATGGAGSTLAEVLRRAGIDTTVIPPAAMPATVLALQSYDLVILEDVPAEAIDPAIQDQLTSFVRDMGGGLVMVGGPDSFGSGGWKGTPVAEILPVELDLPDRVISPEVATIFVIDKSGSMRRNVLGSIKNQQEIANDATALAISSLDRNDLIGVIAFDNNASAVVPLRRNDDINNTIKEVRDIGPGGGTNIAAGMELAIDMLQDVNAKTKHVVILSDGKSQRENDLPDLARELVAMGAKVSTIAVGDDADLGGMSNIANIGNGTYYYASNPNALPKIFLKAIRVVRTPLVREGDFTPVILASGSPMTTGLAADMPPLGGLTLTRPRSQPTIALAMVAPTGEPVLAHWNVGLGQVVAFTSDAHKWADKWLAWPGYERMWTQIVRSASRPPGGNDVQATANVRDGQLTLRAEARDESGTPLPGVEIPATVYAPDGSTREVKLTAIAPGVFESITPASQTGSYVAIVKPQQAGKRLAPAIIGTTLQEGAEFRTLESSDQLLADIAKAGSGRVLDIAQPQLANLFDRTNIKPAEAVTPLWKFLMPLALAALLIDIAMRRVAWDRCFSARFKTAQAAKEALAEKMRGTTAVTSVARVRTRVEETITAPEPSLALSQDDAAKLAAAARDRRRAQRLQPTQPAQPVSTQPAAPVVTNQPAQDEGSGLLAAKRRASKRFDDET
ncbi:MAG TPA: VWA domain-containing protein [Phycisphaerales bacterium]|nr:VWA domain-containing protein [Phycisphaerales bacterium]